MSRADEPVVFAGYMRGMTIREAFAMAAMQGILAGTAGTSAEMQYTPHGCAATARRHADALLAELERTPPNKAAEATQAELRG
jgi:hypothetical protein